MIAEDRLRFMITEDRLSGGIAEFLGSMQDEVFYTNGPSTIGINFQLHLLLI